MAFAWKPGSNLAMTAFMMYMAGSQLNIFSIGIVSGAITSPLFSMFSLSSAFRQFEGTGPSGTEGHVDLTIPKLLFLAMNLVALAGGAYKMSTMGLLPTTSADFEGRVVWKTFGEEAQGGGA